MSLTIGTQLGSHEIIALLGKGGMGEVYRARDLKLKREVAIKVLPEEFSRDADRVSRFQREAEVLASLNHPNIAHIYGVEERALAMELVDGESPKGPMPLEDVAADSGAGGGQFGFSNAGTFAYLPGVYDSTTPLMWLDAGGKTEPLLTMERYGTPRLSPDGQTLALTVISGGNQNVYVYDLQRLTMHRLTFASTNDGYPTWTPDGKHIAFSFGGNTISWVRSDGAGAIQPLLEKTAGATNILPYSFSPDGRRLSYYEINPDSAADIWTVTLDLTDPDHPKAGKPELFLQTPSVEDRGAFSPDGRFMAYESNESGTFQIYVQPFPGRGGKWQVSNTSGRYATWSRAGKQLFFETADGYIMVADYTVNGDTFIHGKPRQWSPVQLREIGSLNMTLHPDGKRFVVFPSPIKTGQEKTGNLHAMFLLNFTDELRRRLPEGK
jgi:hypothetical protein